MPEATRTIRVFISSTFEDMKEERNALQLHVFPKLQTLCEENGARFTAVDLRWGVREEAALDHRTMDICLGEIERCKRTRIKPNFIFLLGNRYGWQPLPDHIDEQDFAALLAAMRDNGSKTLFTSWYDQRDDNAVPPSYVLKPR